MSAYASRACLVGAEMGQEPPSKGSSSPSRIALSCLRIDAWGSCMRRRDFIAGLPSVAIGPLAGRAQQRTTPTIGLLSVATESKSRNQVAAFRSGLGEQGFSEGLNITVLDRWAESQLNRLRDMVEDLVARNVAVIVTTGGSAAAQAARSATTTIPIVFQMGADPVAIGLVDRLDRPGHNITGVTSRHRCWRNVLNCCTKSHRWQRRSPSLSIRLVQMRAEPLSPKPRRTRWASNY
jgi:ABC transporter substrate binding protein